MTTKTYACIAYVLVSRQILVKAKDRQEAIKKASKVAERRYGIGFTETLNVPFLEGDKK